MGGVQEEESRKLASTEGRLGVSLDRGSKVFARAMEVDPGQKWELVKTRRGVYQQNPDGEGVWGNAGIVIYLRETEGSLGCFTNKCPLVRFTF